MSIVKYTNTTFSILLSETTGHFVFDKIRVELRHHSRDGVKRTVNLGKIMPFLVYNANPTAIRQSPIFEDPTVWQLLMDIAQSPDIIDIYDTDTWNGKDYSPVLDVVHRRIANHANHQQRIESMVKAIADHSRTNVGENRRNARNLIESYFTRENNRAAKKLKPNVKRMQCAEGFAHFLDSAHTFSNKISEATNFFDEDQLTVFRKQYRDPSLTQGAIERKRYIEKFTKGLPTCNFHPKLKIEKPGQVEMTCSMGDLIPLSILTLNNKEIDTLKYIKSELKARKVPKEKYKNANIKELKEMLKVCEAQRYVEEDERKSGTKVKDIKVIKPISKRMKELLPLIQEMFRAKYKISKKKSNEDES